MNELLAQALTPVVLIYVVSAMRALGLGQTVSQIIQPLPNMRITISSLVASYIGQLWVWLRQPGPPPRPGATRRWRGGVTIAVLAAALVGHEAGQVQVAAESETAGISDTPNNVVTPL